MGRQLSKSVLEWQNNNIFSGPTKFLGHLQGTSNKSTSFVARDRFMKSFQQKLDNLDQAKIRGKYNIWMYKRYFVSSFLLDYNGLYSCISYQKMQVMVLRKIELAKSSKIFYSLSTPSSQFD